MKRREDINKKKNKDSKIKKYITNEDFDMKIKDFLIAKKIFIKIMISKHTLMA